MFVKSDIILYSRYLNNIVLRYWSHYNSIKIHFYNMMNIKIGFKMSTIITRNYEFENYKRCIFNYNYCRYKNAD